MTKYKNAAKDKVIRLRSHMAVKLLFLLVILLPVSSWAATATLVQSNSAEGSAVASIVSTFTSNVTTGNMIIAFVRLSTLTATTVTVTDTQGNTYVDAVAQNQDTDQHAIHIFYAKNVTGGADTVTAAFSSGANNHPWIAIYEWQNMDTVAPLDKTAVGQGAGVTAATAGTGTTVQGNELLFAGIGVPNNYAGTISIFTGSGYSLLLQDSGLSRAATLAQNQDVTGSWTSSATLSTSTNWSAVLAVFKAVAAPTPTPTVTPTATPTPGGSVNNSGWFF